MEVPPARRIHTATNERFPPAKPTTSSSPGAVPPVPPRRSAPRDSAQAGIDWTKFDRSDQREAVFHGIEEGYFTRPDRHVPGLFAHGPTTGIMNAGHLFGMDALDCRSLSDGMMRGRRFAWEYLRFSRRCGRKAVGCRRKNSPQK